jgi:hypothetical protein
VAGPTIGLRRLETKLLDPIAHLIAIQAQELSGLALMATCTLECLHEKLPLELVELDSTRRKAKR